MNAAGRHRRDLALAVAFALEIHHAYGSASDLAQVLRAPNRARASDLLGGLNHDLGRILALDPADVRVFGRAVIRAFDSIRARQLALDRDLALALDRDPDCVHEVDLAFARLRARLSAFDLADALVHAFNLVLAPARAAEARRVVSAAAGLLAAATWLLPAPDRARYGEEYACELRDLARSGAGLWRQLRYALCQLRCAPQMRLALRSPRGRSAVP
jgi:hypothetical protein